MPQNANNVARLYAKLRQMAADFEFKPDERLNETALSQQLNASRTPLREALNRLVAEGFLTFQSGKGFFCRSLSPEQILNLFEVRVAIECEAVRLAVARATDQQIAQVVAYLTVIEREYDRCRDPIQLLEMDEAFHLRVAGLAGNPEITRILTNVNGRVRYVRTILLRHISDARDRSVDAPQRLSAHRVILNAIAARDEAKAVSAMRSHIQRRREQATEAVRNAYAQIYVKAD